MAVKEMTENKVTAAAESKAEEANKSKPRRFEDLQEAPIERRLLDREAMALVITMSPRSFDELRKLPGFPFINTRVIKKELYDPDDVISWLKQNSQEETCETIKAASQRMDKRLGA